MHLLVLEDLMSRSDTRAAKSLQDFNAKLSQCMALQSKGSQTSIAYTINLLSKSKQILKLNI